MLVLSEMYHSIRGGYAHVKALEAVSVGSRQYLACNVKLLLFVDLHLETVSSGLPRLPTMIISPNVSTFPTDILVKLAVFLRSKSDVCVCVNFSVNI